LSRATGTELASSGDIEVAGTIMSVVRLLGFATLSCGCVVGRYRDVGSAREIRYVEEKGARCDSHAHRRNQTITPERERFAAVASTTAPLHI
jgi:hypothetical protein